MTGFIKKLLGTHLKDPPQTGVITEQEKTRKNDQIKNERKPKKPAFDLDFVLRRATMLEKNQGYDKAIDYLKKGIEISHLKDNEISSMLLKLMPYMKMEKLDTQEIVDYVDLIIINKIKSNKPKLDLYLALANTMKELGDIEEATNICLTSRTFIFPTDQDYYHKYVKNAEVMKGICSIKSIMDSEELFNYFHYYLLKISYNHLWRLESGFKNSDLYQYFYLKKSLQKLINDKYLPYQTLRVFSNDSEFRYVTSKLDIKDFLEVILIDFKKFLFVDLLEKVGWPEEELIRRKKDLENYKIDWDSETFDIVKHNMENIEKISYDYVQNKIKYILKRRESNIMINASK